MIKNPGWDANRHSGETVHAIDVNDLGVQVTNPRHITTL
jgi:hypothetical protein